MSFVRPDPESAVQESSAGQVPLPAFNGNDYSGESIFHCRCSVWHRSYVQSSRKQPLDLPALATRLCLGNQLGDPEHLWRRI